MGTGWPAQGSSAAWAGGGRRERLRFLPGTVSVVVPAGNPRLRRRGKNRPGLDSVAAGLPSRSALADRRRPGSGCGPSASRRGSGCGPSRPGTLPAPHGGGPLWLPAQPASACACWSLFPPAFDPAGVPMSAQASRSPGASGAGWGRRSGRTRSLTAHPGAAGPAPADRRAVAATVRSSVGNRRCHRHRAAADGPADARGARAGRAGRDPL
jgi:hypothetical protein